MIGKCKNVHVILGLVIAVLALWPNILGAVASKWVIVVAAALIVIHAYSCKLCSCEISGTTTGKRKVRKKRRR